MKQEGFIICIWLYGQANGIIILHLRYIWHEWQITENRILFYSEWAV
jgi:hypothetical protein